MSTSAGVADMEHEVEIAVAWWTAHLARPEISVRTEASKRGPATEAEVEAFRDAFRRAVRTHLEPSWRPDDPTWGQGTQAFGVRYGPDEVIVTAMEAAGVYATTWLPLETTMWIDPGRVRVRVGRQAETDTLWTRELGSASDAI